MTPLATRGAGQILRTFLPGQTADLRGGIYQVREWTAPTPIADLADDRIRTALQRQLKTWAPDNDAGMAADLQRGAQLEVVELNETYGVTVERYPKVWLCGHCKRIGKSPDRPCRCGNRKWGQLHFLGFHECGAVLEPWIKRCPTHDDVQLVSPRSARAEDIRFVCPECQNVLGKGLGYPACPGCGKRPVHWNVHKARSVYTPHGTTVINPPRSQSRRALDAAGGAARAVAWVFSGMTAAGPTTMNPKQTAEQLMAQLLGLGIDRPVAATMVETARTAGNLDDGTDSTGLAGIPSPHREDIEFQAVDIAMGCAQSRLSVHDLLGASDDVLDRRYRTTYPRALNRAGLAGLDFVDKFPVLNLMYGYTRGQTDDPGASRLVPFRPPRKPGYRVHGALSETEAYLVRLDPHRVADWLRDRGHSLAVPADGTPEVLRRTLAAADPTPAAHGGPPTIGQDIQTLVHSFAHRFIRQTAVFSGIDRDALSEYLLPTHLGFFVYAAARGDFVLGGLQAVFETDLDQLLDAIVDAEHRCALDPGCARGGGACPACLHLGEPSCRWFNTSLDRRALFGAQGYFRDR